jgi:hypothetical protein
MRVSEVGSSGMAWSERPSDFLASSPVTAPVASLALSKPLALILAAALSSARASPFFGRHVRIASFYLYEIRVERLRLEPGGESPLLMNCREEVFSKTRSAEK